MTNKEQVSTFMDNELGEAGQLDALLSDKVAQQTWERFHMIGDTLRGDTTLAPQAFNIADKIALALENEPAYGLLDANEQDVNKQDVNGQGNVSPLLESQPTPEQTQRELADIAAKDTSKSSWISKSGWLANLTQVGMAACVTLVVVLGVQQYSTQETDVGTVPVLQTVPVAGIAEPVSLTRESLESSAQGANASTQEVEAIEKYRQINALMQDYELQRRLNPRQL